MFGIQQRADLAGFPAFCHVLVAAWTSNCIVCRKCRRDVSRACDFCKEVGESKRIFNCLASSLAVEGSRSVRGVAYDPDWAVVVSGYVGEIPEGPSRRLFEELKISTY